MAKHAAVARRRVTTRRVVAGTSLLTVTAAVLIGAVTSPHPIPAAESQASAAFSGRSTIGEGGSAGFRRAPALLTIAPLATQPAEIEAAIALLETRQAVARRVADRPAVRPFAAPAPSAPPPAPVEQAAPPPVPPASTTEPAPAPEPAPTAPSVESAPAPAAPAPAAPSAEVAPSAEALVTGRTMYATEPVNLRNAPGTKGTSVLVTLDWREQVAAGDPVDGWTPVHAGDFYGWVKSGYLADGTAPAPAAAPAAPEPAGNWMEALLPQVDPNGTATWVFRRNGGWGASDGHTNYIDPGVPSDKRFSVMVHELSHVMQVQVYGSLTKSMAAMSAITGSNSSDVSSNEKTADCMALMLGASWINYGCPDSLRGAASAILAGHRP